MSGAAFDIQSLTRSLDTLDAKGPVSRNVQTAFRLQQIVNLILGDIAAAGAGHFVLSEDWTEVNRTAYEADVTAAISAGATVSGNLKALVKA